jgi:hypothetical protein
MDISVIGINDLLKNKKAAGREKDNADLKNLEGIIKNQKRA